MWDIKGEIEFNVHFLPLHLLAKNFRGIVIIIFPQQPDGKKEKTFKPFLEEKKTNPLKRNILK